MTFLIKYLPAWSMNHDKRLVKAPKILLNDTGLLCHLLGVDTKRLQDDTHTLGKLLENFVIMELCKQASWSHNKPKIFHFRTQTGYEVDLILENAAGEIIGIEIKTSNQVTSSDFRGLNHLAETAGTKFIGGIIFYTGTTSVPAGKKMFAFPIHLLWENL
jgi:predicted AAA+ superfamily ATPase